MRNVGIFLVLAFVDTHGSLQREALHQVDLHGGVGQQPLVFAVLRAQHDVGTGLKLVPEMPLPTTLYLEGVGRVVERNGGIEREGHLEDARRVAVVALGLAELGVGAHLDHAVEEVEPGVDTPRIVLAVVADDDTLLVLGHERSIDLSHLRTAGNAHRMALRKGRIVGQFLIPVGIGAVVPRPDRTRYTRSTRAVRGTCGRSRTKTRPYSWPSHCPAWRVWS